MHNKNNSKTQTFIQGLRPFSKSIPKILKNTLKKEATTIQTLLIIGQKWSVKKFQMHATQLKSEWGKN